MTTALFSIERVTLLYLFRKKELERKAPCPVRCGIGFLDVIVVLDAVVNRLLADLVDTTDTTADRYRPCLVGWRFPVRSDDNVGDQEPALIEVVVSERLYQRLADIGPVVITRKRPQLPSKYAHGTPRWLSQRHCGNASTPLAATELVIRCCRNHQRWSHAPDHLVVLDRRQVKGVVGITQPRRTAQTGWIRIFRAGYRAIDARYREYTTATTGHSPNCSLAKSSAAFAVGRKLYTLMEGDARMVASIDGASIVEEVTTLLIRLVNEITSLQHKHGALEVYCLYQDGENEGLIHELLPPFIKSAAQSAALFVSAITESVSTGVFC